MWADFSRSNTNEKCPWKFNWKKAEEAHKLLDAGVDGKTHLKKAFKELESTVLNGLMLSR